MNSTRNLLVISYFFPPGGGVGMFRAAKFVKYLPEFGWSSHVVSLPSHRQKEITGSSVSDTQYSDIIELPETVEHLENFPPVSISLGGLTWTLPLARKIDSFIAEKDIDAVFHTGSPFIPMVAGLLSYSTTNVPYIVDFRDPWYGTQELFSNTRSISNPIWGKINKQLERFVIDQSDAVILNTKNMTDIYSNVYENSITKFHTITNGFDPEDYPEKVEESNGKFRLIYPGKFRDGYHAFLDAYENVISELDKDVQFIHYGPDEHLHTQNFYEDADNTGVANTIDSRGYADLESIVPAIRSADVGIVITRPDDPTHVPTKIFDYMACNIPVLALDSPDGALAKIIEPFDHAYCAQHQDREQIKNLLSHVLTTAPKTIGRQEQIEQYTRENLTSQLSNLLDDYSSHSQT